MVIASSEGLPQPRQICVCNRGPGSLLSLKVFFTVDGTTRRAERSSLRLQPLNAEKKKRRKTCLGKAFIFLCKEWKGRRMTARKRKQYIQCSQRSIARYWQSSWCQICLSFFRSHLPGFLTTRRRVSIYRNAVSTLWMLFIIASVSVCMIRWPDLISHWASSLIVAADARCSIRISALLNCEGFLEEKYAVCGALNHEGAPGCRHENVVYTYVYTYKCSRRP